MAHASALMGHRRRAPNARRSSRGGPMTTPHSQLNYLIAAAADRGEQDVLRLVQEHSSDMGLVNVCTVWHSLASFATSGEADADHRLTTLTQRTQELLLTALEEPKCEPHPRCVATITWSLAKLKVHQRAMLSALGDLAIRWLTHFKPTDLVNVLWGFAKLKFQHGAFLQVAQDHLLEAAHLFTARSLSLAAWSFATIRFQSSKGLLRRMADAFVSALKLGDEVASPVTLTNMLWALATLRADVQQETLVFVRCTAADAMESFEAHELSVVLWSLAHLEACDVHLLSKAADLLRAKPRLLEDMQAEDVAKLLCSFTRSDCRQHTSILSGDILAQLLGACLRLLPKLKSAEISTFVTAIARLVPRSGEDQLADRVLEEVAKRLLGEQELLSSLAAHGSVLAAYADFFCDCPHIPASCVDLCAHLSPRCRKQPAEELDGQADACRDPAGPEEIAMGLATIATHSRQESGLQRPVAEGEPVVVFTNYISEDGRPEVEVEFEVDRMGRDDIHCICVDTYGSCTVDDRCVFPVTSATERISHKLKVQQPCGRWYVSVAVLSTQGQTLGKPSSVSYPGALPQKRLAVQSFASASTCLGSDVHSSSDSESALWD